MNTCSLITVIEPPPLTTTSVPPVNATLPPASNATLPVLPPPEQCEIISLPSHCRDYMPYSQVTIQF